MKYKKKLSVAAKLLEKERERCAVKETDSTWSWSKETWCYPMINKEKLSGVRSEAI